MAANVLRFVLHALTLWETRTLQEGVLMKKRLPIAVVIVLAGLALILAQQATQRKELMLFIVLIAAAVFLWQKVQGKSN